MPATWVAGLAGLFVALFLTQTIFTQLIGDGGMRHPQPLRQLTCAGVAAIELGQHRALKAAGDVVQRPFHGLLAHRQRGDVMVRQQNVLWTQLKSFQLGQCAIDGILQLADVAGPAVAGKHRTEIGRELRPRDPLLVGKAGHETAPSAA